jgi:protein-S-isoprenylcysteine O-methyltransferase Ste14
MLQLFGPWFLALLLVSCLASFSWGISRSFVQPSGSTPGMRAIKACSAVFAFVHLAAILLSNNPGLLFFSVAVALYGTSLALFWWAIGTHRQKRLSAVFSTDLPSELVDRGPYRFIRHPFYTSYLLTWLAGVPASGEIWLVPTVAVMYFVYRTAALMEEDKFRRSSLADAYESYRARTGRFLPKIFAGSRLPGKAANRG